MSAKKPRCAAGSSLLQPAHWGTTFINFGGDYPNQTFAGFIAAGSPIASDQRLTMIQGKTIGIAGTIRLRDGKPEIEILSADQIKIWILRRNDESRAQKIFLCPS